MKSMRCRRRLDDGHLLGLSCSWTVRTVKVFAYRLVLTLQVSCTVLAGGCGSADSIPLCSDVDWIGRYDEAQLTGAPTLSAMQIAPGDPLTVAVPVDANTRDVRVHIWPLDPSVPGTSGKAETNGGEIVEVRMVETNLTPGLYLVGTLVLNGAHSSPWPIVGYDTRDPALPYVLSRHQVPEFSDKCVTEIAAPTLTVVNNASDPERPFD